MIESHLEAGRQDLVPGVRAAGTASRSPTPASASTRRCRCCARSRRRSRRGGAGADLSSRDRAGEGRVESAGSPYSSRMSRLARLALPDRAARARAPSSTERHGAMHAAMAARSLRRRAAAASDPRLSARSCQLLQVPGPVANLRWPRGSGIVVVVTSKERFIAVCPCADMHLALRGRAARRPGPDVGVRQGDRQADADVGDVRLRRRQQRRLRALGDRDLGRAGRVGAAALARAGSMTAGDVAARAGD